MMMYVKQKQREKTLARRVKRPIPFGERTPLSALIPGMEVSGIVISLTSYGAYVDIGSECDGLLHVSQITRNTFVSHPSKVFTPGEEITVRVRSASPTLKKLHLTQLPLEVLAAEGFNPDEIDDDEDNSSNGRIRLDEFAVDDELWGIIRRVTDYGAYIDVGAVVPGFLHFMDHPAFGWSNGDHPSSYMNVADRVRVWVSHIDEQLNRIKLTANRPPHLPGPRRDRG
jgi:small subunit ribosomal protein S1